MTPKQEAVTHMTSRLLRIINKHSRIEELPIRIDQNIELTAREIHTLQAAGEFPGSNIKSLAERLGVTKSAASQMIGKLESKGFLRKEKAPNNDKETLVFLTERGQEAFAIHKEFHERHMHTLFERLDAFSDPQLATTAAILAEVESVVDERMAEIFGK